MPQLVIYIRTCATPACPLTHALSKLGSFEVLQHSKYVATMHANNFRDDNKQGKCNAQGARPWADAAPSPGLSFCFLHVKNKRSLGTRLERARLGMFELVVGMFRRNGIVER